MSSLLVTSGGFVPTPRDGVASGLGSGLGLARGGWLSGRGSGFVPEGFVSGLGLTTTGFPDGRGSGIASGRGSTATTGFAAGRASGFGRARTGLGFVCGCDSDGFGLVCGGSDSIRIGCAGRCRRGRASCEVCSCDVCSYDVFSYDAYSCVCSWELGQAEPLPWLTIVQPEANAQTEASAKQCRIMGCWRKGG
jgi:hypothetical protein